MNNFDISRVNLLIYDAVLLLKKAESHSDTVKKKNGTTHFEA